MRPLRFAALLLLGAAAVPAQEADPVYQEKRLHFDLTGGARREWTQDRDSAFTEDGRHRFRLVPLVTAEWEAIALGVGGDFIYSSDKNTDPPEGQTTRALIRDNYKSRNARLDRAFLRVDPASWFRIELGRIAMPVGVTEMIWDKDLRVQGGAVTLTARDAGPFKRLSLTGLGLRGGHVFETEGTRLKNGDTQMGMAAVTAAFEREDAIVGGEVVVAFMTWSDLDDLFPAIRRQNTRVGAFVPDEFDVVDAVFRVHRDGAVRLELVAEGCLNTAIDTKNRGLWLAAVLGSTKTARAAFEYTFAYVENDATVAAYATDDFIWGTGWEGHRADLGFRISDRTNLHLVGQLQRFSGASDPAVQDRWDRRIRLESRIHLP